MIKSLSPFNVTTSWISGITGLTCISYTLEIFAWNGSKANSGTIPTYSLRKDNLTTSTGVDVVNIARLVNDFLRITPQTGTTTEAIAGGNQIWVKTQVKYNTSNASEADTPQNVEVDLMLKGYGYGMEGENTQPPTNKVFLQGTEFKVFRDNVFNVPVLIDETPSTINAVNDTIDIFYQETILLVLGNDNLGFQPTNIIRVVTSMDSDVGTLAINGDTIVFTEGISLGTTENILLRSEEFDNVIWDKTRSSVISNQEISPDKTITADKLIDNTDNNSHFTRQIADAGLNETIVFSIFIKKEELQYVYLRLIDNPANINSGVNRYEIVVDLENGIITDTGSSLGTPLNPFSNIVDYGNGWYKCYLGVTKQGDATRTDCFIYTYDSQTWRSDPSYIGDGTSGMYLWGAQLEESSIVGQYGKTEGTGGTVDVTLRSEAFDYTIEDATGIESTATVMINIVELPATVTAVDDYYELNETDIVVLDVMANDSEGTPPTTITTVVQTGITSGVITITNGGADLTFTPNGIIPLTNETFTYTIEDSLASTDQATVTLRVISDANSYLLRVANIGIVDTVTVTGDYAAGGSFSFDILPNDAVDINACVVTASLNSVPNMLPIFDLNLNC